MRCPKCKYEPTMAEQTNNKDQCPSCGIFYAKYMAHLKAKSSADNQVEKAETSTISTSPSKKAVQTLNGSQPVVVVDIQMKFWSMVVFMVKWAFAAIPALIIIALIITALTMFLTGFISGLGKSQKVASYPSSLTSGAADQVNTKENPAASKPVKAELISAVLVDKGFSEERFQKSNTFKISFENKTGRQVRAFEGIVVLSDLLGNVITRVRLSESEPDWSGDKILWSGSIDYNQFISKDQELKNASMDSLKMQFEIKKILYVDGELQEF